MLSKTAHANLHLAQNTSVYSTVLTCGERVGSVAALILKGSRQPHPLDLVFCESMNPPSAYVNINDPVSTALPQPLCVL